MGRKSPLGCLGANLVLEALLACRGVEAVHHRAAWFASAAPGWAGLRPASSPILVWLEYFTVPIKSIASASNQMPGRRADRP
jgi:hypothetical protein